MVNLGDAIEARRRALFLSRGDLAKKAKVDRGYIGRVEAGKRTPSLVVLERIAAALQTTAGALLNEAKPGRKKRSAS